MSYKKQIIDIVVNFVLSKIWAKLKKKPSKAQETLTSALEEAKGLEADLSARDQRIQIPEIRSSKVQTYITSTEKEKFISLLGRETVSDAIRNLIVQYIKDKGKPGKESMTPPTNAV